MNKLDKSGQQGENYVMNKILPMTDLHQIAFVNNSADAKCVMKLEKDYTTHLYVAKRNYRF